MTPSQVAANIPIAKRFPSVIFIVASTDSRRTTLSEPTLFLFFVQPIVERARPPNQSAVLTHKLPAYLCDLIFLEIEFGPKKSPSNLEKEQDVRFGSKADMAWEIVVPDDASEESTFNTGLIFGFAL